MKNINRLIGVICLLLIAVMVELESAVGLTEHIIGKILPIIPAVTLIIIAIKRDKNNKEDDDDNSGVN